MAMAALTGISCAEPSLRRGVDGLPSRYPDEKKMRRLLELEPAELEGELWEMAFVNNEAENIDGVLQDERMFERIEDLLEA